MMFPTEDKVNTICKSNRPSSPLHFKRSNKSTCVDKKTHQQHIEKGNSLNSSDLNTSSKRLDNDGQYMPTLNNQYYSHTNNGQKLDDINLSSKPKVDDYSDSKKDISSHGGNTGNSLPYSSEYITSTNEQYSLPKNDLDVSLESKLHDNSYSLKEFSSYGDNLGHSSFGTKMQYYEPINDWNSHFSSKRKVDDNSDSNNANETSSDPTIVKRLRKEVADLTNRLSKEISDKVAENETSIENVNIFNRPMNITDEYQTLCTTTWYNAKVELDQLEPNLEETIKLKILFDVFKIAESYATKLYEEKMMQIAGIIMNQSAQIKEKQDCLKSFRIGISDAFRKYADTADLSECIQLIEDEVMEGQSVAEGPLKGQRVQEYFNAVALLTWKMALQRPPMSFKACETGKPYNDAEQSAFWCSSDPNDPKSLIDIWIYPSLMHGNKLMAKGMVLLKIPIV